MEIPFTRCSLAERNSPSKRRYFPEPTACTTIAPDRRSAAFAAEAARPAHGLYATLLAQDVRPRVQIKREKALGDRPVAHKAHVRECKRARLPARQSL